MIGISPTLIDYNVKSVTGGTDALGEVTVRLGDEKNVYTGKGTSLDIVEASAKAYVQAVNKLVYFNIKRKRAGNGSNNH
jgi:2-isopropylmalate synthase